MNSGSCRGIALLCSQQSKAGRSLAFARQTRPRHFNVTKAMASEESIAVKEHDGGADASSQPNLVVVGAGTLGTLAAQCWKQVSAFQHGMSTLTCSRVHDCISPTSNYFGPLGDPLHCRDTPRPWCMASPARPTVILSFVRSG